MKQTTGDWLILILISIILGLGIVESYNQEQYIQTLEEQLETLTGQYKLLDYDVLELEEKSDTTVDSISVLKADLSDYINKHQFSHDLDVVLTKAELHLMVEEIVNGYLESDGE